MWKKLAAVASLVALTGCISDENRQAEAKLDAFDRQNAEEGKIPDSISCSISYDKQGKSHLTYDIKTIKSKKRGEYAIGHDYLLAQAAVMFGRSGLKRIQSVSYYDKTSGEHGGCEVWREP